MSGSEPMPAAHHSSLTRLGWSPDRAAAFAPHANAGLVPGRVIASGGATTAMTAAGACEVVLQRRFRQAAVGATDLPAVGDWLALERMAGTPPRAALRAILGRSGLFIRHRPSDDQAQVLAANVDIALIVCGLDHDLNLRRLERYLVLAFDAGVTPVVVLNKVDVALELERHVTEVHRVAAGTRIVIASALRGVGLSEIRALLAPGTTSCLLGSSGVGKSTIANALLGEPRQAVNQLREDDGRGRHTTTRRELFAIPDGGLVIDTPGLRTVGLPGEPQGLAASFAEVEGLARGCRFRDCQHAGEPGCAVQAALDEGTIAADRIDSHRKLEAERRWAGLRSDAIARRAADRRLGRMYRKAGRASERYKHGEA